MQFNDIDESSPKSITTIMIKFNREKLNRSYFREIFWPFITKSKDDRATLEK